MQSDKIIQCSVPRSGSTLITQILKSVFPETKIQKVHGFIKNSHNVPIILTYRDFRDVLVSSWRVREDIPFVELDNGRKISLKELNDTLKFICARIDSALNHTTSVYKENCLILKYEYFYNNFDYIFSNIEEFFHIKLSDSLKELIKQDNNLKANKKRSLKFDSFHNKNWDDTGIHGLHVYTGEVGIWKRFVPLEHHDFINNSLKIYLDQWGYE